MSENGLALVGNEELAVNFKALVNEIVGLQDLIEELKSENEELRDNLSDLEGRFESFAKPCAIGVEQLWDKVYPGVSGVDLRDLV